MMRWVFLALILSSSPSLAEDVTKTISEPDESLSSIERAKFRAGDGVFRKIWEHRPGMPSHQDGLGPTFNADTCIACHINDGRGEAPGLRSGDLGFVFLKVDPDPVDGQEIYEFLKSLDGQIQDKSIPGHAVEAEPSVSFKEIVVTYPDGDQATLRRPIFKVNEISSEGIQSGIGGRIAQPLIGLGLLEDISEARLDQLSDPEDRDGDGVSGRKNILEDGTTGRFGWKASQSSVENQVILALREDMGILYAEDSKSDVKPAELELLEIHSSSIRPPSPSDHPGKALFLSAGCASCHTDKHRLEDGRVIEPYTNLLLHDMGPGLADGIRKSTATGSEFRTAPLWGLGSSPKAPYQPGFLHDGRALTLEEAILWHGGEAEASRTRFMSLSKSDRDDLIAFLESL